MHSSDPGNFGRKLFSYCCIAEICRSLRLLGLHTMRLLDHFCFASELIRKKYLVIIFLISSRLFYVVPPWVTMSILNLCSTLPLSKVHSKAIFTTVNVVPVLTTALSKLLSSYRMNSGEPALKVSILNL